MFNMTFFLRLPVTLIALICAAFILCGCGCSKDKRAFRIGIDPNWYPLNFEAQQAYVNGFMEDLFIEIAGYSGMTLERVDANWDTLLDGMYDKRYDAVLTSIPPYNFNVAKYEFSQNVLDLGPVLLLSNSSETKSLKDLSNEPVAVVTGDSAALVLQKYPEVLMRSYPSVVEMLQALEVGEVQGALLDQLQASAYVRDIFAGKLKIVGSPLSSKGLHLAVLKDQQNHRLELFDKSLSHLKKKKMQELLAKWQLAE
jgi:ABC-type amino acid transport substrate-binding protein